MSGCIVCRTCSGSGNTYLGFCGRCNGKGWHKAPVNPEKMNALGKAAKAAAFKATEESINRMKESEMNKKPEPKNAQVPPPAGKPEPKQINLQDVLGVLDRTAQAAGIPVLVILRNNGRAPGPVTTTSFGPMNSGDAHGMLALATLGLEEELRLEYRKQKAASDAARATQ